MYANRRRSGIRSCSGIVPINSRRAFVSVWLAGAVALLLLLAAGTAYRVMASRLRTILSTAIALPVPLRKIPVQIGGWQGQELPIPAVTEDYMRTNFADDFISRRYKDAARGLWADVYVVYCASRPSGLLGHKPRVCLPAHGWIHDSTVPSEIVSSSGRPIKCLLHRFHNVPAYQQVVVLSFYVLNGQVTLSEREFSGFFGRRPNIRGNPARYVAQVQVSSLVEYSARAAAREMVDTILSFLPDQDGAVWAMGSVETSSQPAGQADDSSR